MPDKMIPPPLPPKFHSGERITEKQDPHVSEENISEQVPVTPLPVDEVQDVNENEQDYLVTEQIRTVNIVEEEKEPGDTEEPEEETEFSVEEVESNESDTVKPSFDEIIAPREEDSPVVKKKNLWPSRIIIALACVLAVAAAVYFLLMPL